MAIHWRAVKISLRGTLMLLSGAWGKVIHEKNLKKKISWHCPFKPKSVQCVFKEATRVNLLKTKSVFHSSAFSEVFQRSRTKTFVSIWKDSQNLYNLPKKLSENPRHFVKLALFSITQKKYVKKCTKSAWSYISDAWWHQVNHYFLQCAMEVTVTTCQTDLLPSRWFSSGSSSWSLQQEAGWPEEDTFADRNKTASGQL